MANLKLDDSGRPIPQIQNEAGTDFIPWKGENNAGRITGDVAHDNADAGKPIKIGGKATDPASLPADVAAADRVNALFDLKGRLFVRQDVASALPAGAATEAKQDTLIAKDFATQTTLAAILAKIITAPATEAKQDSIIGYIDSLEALLTAIKDTDGIKKITDQLPAGTNNIGSVNTELPDAAALADSAANPIAPMMGSGELLYNGATWDRKRNNVVGTLLASAARTETQTTPDQTNYNSRGIHVILDVTAIVDTPSITLKIEGKSASGIYYTLLEGAAVTGVGTHIYKVMPWATPVANEAVADLLPRTWRVVVTHADADSITYSVDYALDC